MFTCGAKMIASLAQHRLILFPYIHVMCSGVLHVQCIYKCILSWLYRVHNHQNHVQEDEEMEEEDVEVDQENAETNSAGGNVRIQIYSFRIYIQCIL